MSTTVKGTALSVMLLLSSIGALEAQELTTSEIAMVKAEAQHHIETYYNHYYERDMSPLPVSIFNIPWILLGGSGIQVTETADEALASFESSLQSLLDRDWNRSIYRTSNVCVLNASAAIVSGTNTRTRTDGSIMSVGGVSYILGKTGEEWRIVSYAGHAPDQVVRCE